MRLSEGNPFKTCANPHPCDQKLSRANRYENEMVSGSGSVPEPPCLLQTPKQRLDKVMHDTQTQRQLESIAAKIITKKLFTKKMFWSN